MTAAKLPVAFVVPGLGRACWLWAPGAVIPAGVVIEHDDHRVLVAWGDCPLADAAGFTLESLIPLTVTEDVSCPTCGITGRLQAGAWMPGRSTEGVDRR